VSKLSAQKERDIPLNIRLPPARGVSLGWTEDPSEEERKSLLAVNQRQQFSVIENDREFLEAQMEEREKGIKEIETTIIEINEITKDLGLLVHEQGSMIDNIESHIDTAVMQSSLGVEELRQASDYQKSGKGKMCWIILIISVVLIIVLLFILVPILIKT